MNLYCIVFGIVFLVIGIVFICGKGHEHISAWKSMTQEEKDKIRIIPLTRNIGAVISLSGVILLIKGFCSAFSGKWFVIAMIAWLVIAGADVLYIEKSKKYENQ